jgi:hypothetical protein
MTWVTWEVHSAHSEGSQGNDNGHTAIFQGLWTIGVASDSDDTASCGLAKAASLLIPFHLSAPISFYPFSMGHKTVNRRRPSIAMKGNW